MSAPDQIVTKKPLPVLIGFNYEHVMGQATIVVTPENATITIVIEGNPNAGRGRTLGEFLASPEVVALSFAGVPVRPRPEGA